MYVVCLNLLNILLFRATAAFHVCTQAAVEPVLRVHEGITGAVLNVRMCTRILSTTLSSLSFQVYHILTALKKNQCVRGMMVL